MLTTVLTFLLVVNLLIFVHELGHLWAAKANGIPASDFAVGFGPSLLSFTRGETTYRLCALPLGGYVKFEGQGALDSRYPLGGRMATVVAGVLMNLALAFVLFTSIPMTWGTRAPIPPVVGEVETTELPDGVHGFEKLEAGDRILRVADRHNPESWQEFLLGLTTAPDGPFELALADGRTIEVRVDGGREATGALLEALRPRRPAVIGAVRDGSPAERAGIEVGDHVRTLDGQAVEGWKGLRAAVRARPGERVSMTVRRDGASRELTVQLGRHMEDGHAVGTLGVEAGLPRERSGPGDALAYGVQETVESAELIWVSLASIVEGRISPRQMGGPVAVADLADRMRRVGWDRLVHFTALVSVNLALLNFLPFPALDGGHFLLLLVEGVRRKPVPDRWVHGLNRVGMALLMALMVLVVLNDILRLIGI